MPENSGASVSVNFSTVYDPSVNRATCGKNCMIALKMVGFVIEEIPLFCKPLHIAFRYALRNVYISFASRSPNTPYIGLIAVLNVTLEIFPLFFCAGDISPNKALSDCSLNKSKIARQNASMLLSYSARDFISRTSSEGTGRCFVLISTKRRVYSLRESPL